MSKSLDTSAALYIGLMKMCLKQEEKIFSPFQRSGNHTPNSHGSHAVLQHEDLLWGALGGTRGRECQDR